MVEIIVDGQRFQVEEHKKVIQIARAQGIKIPGLCYHPALSPVGSCQRCVLLNVRSREESEPLPSPVL